MPSFSIKHYLHKIIPAVILCIGLLGNNSANAQTPTYAYNPAIVTNSSAPLANATNNMAQYLFTPGDFATTVPSGVTITTIYVKAGNNRPAGGTFTDLNISLGTTSLTTLTSGAWISGLTSSYFATSTTFSSWSANNWVPITLQTPFSWNGTDNLIVEISQGGYTTGMTLKQGTVSGRNGRIYGSESSSTSTNDDARLISFGFDWGCTGTPSPPSITSTAIPAATPLCSGSTTTITATDPNAPVSGITYQWQSSTSATGPWADVTNGTGATTLTYTTGTLSSDTYFRVAAICTASSSATYSNSFVVPVGAPQPGVITGTATYCPGDPETYTVPNVAGNTYTWTLPSGWSGTSTTNVIVAVPGATGGTISVTTTSTCGTSIAQTMAINATGTAPIQPGNINGNSMICGGTTQTYSVTPTAGATSYTWTLPSGWSGTSTTNSITVTAGSASGNVTVAAENGCGSSTSRTLAVNIVTVLSNPGTITGSATVCSGTIETYSINPVPTATSYSWTLPSGWSGTTSGTSIQAIPSGASGNVTVTAYSACASSPTSSLSIAANTTVTPVVSIAGSASAVCQNTPVTFTATPSNGGTAPVYQWKKNGSNVASTGPTYNDNSLTNSDVISVEMTSNAGCITTTTASSNGVTTRVTPLVTPGINVNTVPSINICEGTVLTFYSNITGGGTAPAYQWYKNGAAIGGIAGTGTSYVDGTLQDQDVITVELTTNAACATSSTAISNNVVVSVTAIVTPSISITASSTMLNGTPITFTAIESGGGATPQYQWMKNNVDIPLATSNTYTTSTLHDGDLIAVKMLSTAPCATQDLVTSNQIKVRSTLGVPTAAGWDGTISLYPNPNNGHFAIAAAWDAKHSGKRVSIDVLNTIGQNVYHSEVAPDGNKWHFDVRLTEGVANGTYMLRVSGDGMRTTVPFVLNR